MRQRVRFTPNSGHTEAPERVGRKKQTFGGSRTGRTQKADIGCLLNPLTTSEAGFDVQRAMAERNAGVPGAHPRNFRWPVA